MKESRPVIVRNLAQCVHQVLESVVLQLRTIVLPSIEQAAEVVQRFFALCLAVDDAVDFEPEQNAFIIEVHTTSPVPPLSGTIIKDLRVGRGIEQRAPGPPGQTRTISGGNQSKVLPELTRTPQPASRR